MSFRLSELLKFDDIVIQCHDNPDADAIASGYALLYYFNKKGKKARFVYGGKFEISKCNLKLMVENLDIPIEFVKEINNPELLVTVDCQYKESNVTFFEAKNVATIDHHQVSGTLPEISEVRSAYGACSTVLFEMMKVEGIDINEDEKLATALYYGLMTDTNLFTEVHHPADKDLRDYAQFRNSDITLFRNSNISKEELAIAGDALNSAFFDEKNRYAVVEAKPCDPNILGIISDMLLEVDSVSTCLVYSVLPFGVKTSVRSCVKGVRASELAEYLAEGIGGGGGHLIKAGGFLKKDLMEVKGIIFSPEEIRQYLLDRMELYYASSRILYAGEHKEDVSKLKKYVKKALKVGFVKSEDIAPVGTLVTIRTLEGDVDVTVDEDTYIVLGIEGEIYPISRKKFMAGYVVSEEPYEFVGEYAPAVINVTTGERLEILPFARSCVSSRGNEIYARRLDERVKVFTSWDPDKYYLGVPGDYLAVRVDDLSDIYIVASSIFAQSYEEV